MSSPKAEGTICQESPYLSFSQPHLSFDPPSDSLSQSSSTSCCVSQFTKSEIAGVKLNIGPPFNAWKRCPSKSKLTSKTDPFGPGPPSPFLLILTTFEFLKMKT